MLHNKIFFFSILGIILQEYPQMEENDFLLIIMNDAQCCLLKQFGNNIICIDDTHGMNAYGFNLTTVLVVDELGQGFPCAFMLSNRGNFDAVKIFISKIAEFTGILHPNTLMTDMAQVFYNGWTASMGRPKYRLFCAWHVDHAWRQNLHRIQGGRTKQAQVYRLLRTVLEETDEDTFERIILIAIDNLLTDADSQEFGNSFSIIHVIYSLKRLKNYR